MSNIIPRLKRLSLDAIPTVLFFFIVFQLLSLTKVLLLKTYGIQVSAFLNATIAALVIGKVVSIVDLLPFMNLFPHKPLIYNVVWKTFIYVLAALLARYIENLIPFIYEYSSFTAANNFLLDQTVWHHFWLVQLWLMVCFVMYSTIREIGRVLGRKKLRSMFFGPGRLD